MTLISSVQQRNAHRNRFKKNAEKKQAREIVIYHTRDLTGLSCREIVAIVDQLMYQAERSGKGAVVFSVPGEAVHRALQRTRQKQNATDILR